MKMHLKPIFLYYSKELAKGILACFLTLLLMAALTTAILYVNGETISRTSVSLTGSLFIFAFVIAIVAARSQMRLALQFGISRLTAFVNHLLCGFLLSAFLFLCNGLTDKGQFFFKYATQKFAGLVFTDAVFQFLVLFCLYLFGTFLSLLFWRLNRTGAIVVIVSMIVLINLASGLFGVNLIPFAKWLVASPSRIILPLLLLSGAFGAGSWFALRRANIHGAVAG